MQQRTGADGVATLNPKPAAGGESAAGGTDALKLYKSVDGYRAIMEWYESLVEKIAVPFESLYVNTRFGRTHLLAAGPKNAPALFLISGVAGCAPLWRKQLESLSGEFRVYAVDIPGQPGRSDPNPPSFLNDDYCDWLLDVLDDLGIERAHVAGISAGAWIAMRFGSRHPARVGKVVMLGPTGISSARLPVKIWLGRVAQKWKNADVLQDDLTAKSVSSKSPGGTFGTFDRQLARAMALCTRHYRVDRSLGIYNEATGKVNLWQGLKVLRKFFLPEPDAVLRQFGVPGLLIFGEHEVLYDPHAVGRKATRLMGDIRVEVVAGAGHAAIYDRPEYVDNLVAGFLRA
ncbi:MAG: alpha/beta hydrolase [Gammaproteobacteria bacterium]|nr:alpha/beta hydrolase [Gammaproteobacteria bacterium]